MGKFFLQYKIIDSIIEYSIYKQIKKQVDDYRKLAKFIKTRHISLNLLPFLIKWLDWQI